MKKTHHDFFSSNLVKLDLDLDPDPHSEKMLDPDPHKMNADPQPWVIAMRTVCCVGYITVTFGRDPGLSNQTAWAGPSQPQLEATRIVPLPTP